MKNIIFIIIFLVYSFESLVARVEMSDTSVTCRNMIFFLWEDFLNKGSDLPSSFDDIQSYRDVLETYSNPRTLVGTIGIINRLAIVPDAPVIQAGEGISRERQNRRLFAISRSMSFDYPSPEPTGDLPKGGRFAIVITPDGSDALPYWISESEARLILRQIDGFDPAKQPLAFEDLIQVANKSLPRGWKSKITGAANQAEESNRLPWVLGIFGAVAILAAVVVIFRKRKAS